MYLCLLFNLELSEYVKGYPEPTGTPEEDFVSGGTLEHVNEIVTKLCGLGNEFWLRLQPSNYESSSDCFTTH